MTGRAVRLSPFSASAPGADDGAIEQSVSSDLIKLHHPDREGGDARRAAEITRALSASFAPAAPRPIPSSSMMRSRNGPRRRWRLAAAFAIAGIAAAVFVVAPSVPLTRTLSAASAQLPTSHLFKPDPIDGELHVAAIDAAVSQALPLFRTRDEAALADVSRDCGRRFRDDPGARFLDRCAAFDDAVAGLGRSRSAERRWALCAARGHRTPQWSAASCALRRQSGDRRAASFGSGFAMSMLLAPAGRSQLRRPGRTASAVGSPRSRHRRDEADGLPRGCSFRSYRLSDESAYLRLSDNSNFFV